MALIAQNKQLTLAEVNKLSGNVDTGNVLAEMAQNNSLLDELPWFPSTHGSHNETFKAKSLGTGAFTKINGGIPVMGSTGDVFKEPVRLYEGESEVDDRLLNAADIPFTVRDTYDVMNLEGILQVFNRALVYANPVNDPDAFKGFALRRATLGPYTWSGGGTGTAGLTSAWLMELGRNGVFLTYNKAGSPGLKNEDRGKHSKLAADNNPYWIWVRHYEIWAGVNIGNERGLQRYANIKSDGSSNSFDAKVLIKMNAQLPTIGGNRAVLFVPRALFAQIEQAAWDKSNMAYTIANFEHFGPVPMVAGVIVRPEEAISENESAIS